MACTLTIVLGRQRDLQVALFGLVAQIVMADETVEVEGRGRTRISIDRDDFWNATHNLGRLDQHALRRFERSAFRQIDDDLKL